MFERVISKIADLNAWLVYVMLVAAAILAFSLGFLVCADIVGRGVFNSPVKGTHEMVSMAIVIICFLLAAYAVQSRSMISADVFVSSLGWRGPVFSTLLSAVLGAILFGLIMWGSWEPLMHAINSGEYEGEGALRVPTWPARVGVMFGSALVMLNYVGQAIIAIVQLARNIPPPKADERISAH